MNDPRNPNLITETGSVRLSKKIVEIFTRIHKAVPEVSDEIPQELHEEFLEQFLW